jgi:Maltokinase N-terminal cap domain
MTRGNYCGRMAMLHEATISPRKDELVGPWLRTRPWWDGEAERAPVGSFRLDDPAGEVGMECFLFGSASGSTLFVPVTYRAAPLPGRDASLLGTMEHSVLGTRYVYDAAADPVFVATALDTIRSGGRHADLLLIRADGTEVHREPTATACGDGASTVPRHDPGVPVSSMEESDRTVVACADVEVTVMRRLGPGPQGPALIGSFEGGSDLRLVIVSG